MPRRILGPGFNMQAEAEKHAADRARGNSSTNVRGDTIDADGNIVKTVGEKARDGHLGTQRTRESMADIGFSPAAPAQNDNSGDDAETPPAPQKDADAAASTLDADMKSDTTMPADDLVEDADGNWVPRAELAANSDSAATPGTKPQAKKTTKKTTTTKPAKEASE